jgi:hypothetical protein
VHERKGRVVARDARDGRLKVQKRRFLHLGGDFGAKTARARRLVRHDAAARLFYGGHDGRRVRLVDADGVRVLCDVDEVIRQDATLEALAALKSSMPIAHDAPPAPKDPSSKDPSSKDPASKDAAADDAATKTTASRTPRAPGLTAQAFGVRFLPTTVLVDRSGKVRAAGVKPEKTKELVETLLSEEAR